MMANTLPRRIRGLALLATGLLVLSACSEHPVEDVSLFDEDEALHMEVDDLFEYDEEQVNPLFTVSIDDVNIARNVFEEGIAHFESADPFTQVSWMMDAEDVSELQFSALRLDGTWTDWKDVTITFNEEIFYNALVVLEEQATELKLRGGESIHSAHLEFYDRVLARPEIVLGEDFEVILEQPSAEEEDLRASIQASVAPSSLVVSRSQWGASSPNKICGSVVNPWRMAIHHTYRPAGDGGNPAARMRQMQSYHMNTLGWCDIGYHFVVSQSGQIFQGRSRSDRPGSHVGGQNSGNVGISFIADFTVQTPTNTQLNAGADIMRWVHNTHGVPLNRQRVLGHREHSGQSTSCPGGNMIPFINELISRAQSGGQPTPPPPPPPTPGGCTPAADDNASNSFFKDFRITATGYDDAIRLYNAGITQGCSASPRMYCPNCPLNRRQMAVFLARAANLNTSNPPSTATFSDVPVGSAGFAYVEAVAAAGITLGCGNGQFCPNDEITRAQAATMIKRAAGWPDEVPAGAPSFSDVAAGNTHYAAIETLKTRCVTQGCSAGKFCPNDNLSRAHAAVFISRAFNLEGNNPCAQPGGCNAHPAFGTENSVFADFPTSSFGYSEAVQLYDHGITQGCSATPSLMYCPNCDLTRRQMVMFIARAAGLDTSNPPATPTFSDIGPGASGYAEIEAAHAAGIVNGCGGGNFCPNNDVTRAQVATMLARAQGWANPNPQGATFSDVPVGAPHHAGVEALADRCVTQGCRAGEFCPNGRVSRAHAAIFIARAFDLDGINPCVANPGGGFGDPGPIVEPGSDTEDEDEPGVLPGESCEDVDPDFQENACMEEDPADPADPVDGGDSDDAPSEDSDSDSDQGGNDSAQDDGQALAVQGGCSQSGGSDQGPLAILLGLVGLVALRLRR